MSQTRLKCQCCGFEDSLTGEEAFERGWDAPPHFTQVVCCPLCPAVAALGIVDHSKAHARWAIEGRPKTFEEQMGQRGSS